MGFKLSTPSQPNLFTRVNGTKIPSNTIFVTFCPDPLQCQYSTTVTYYLKLTDSKANGWNGTVLGFRANGVILSNFTLASGGSAGPTPFTFDKYVKVEIVVLVLKASSI